MLAAENVEEVLPLPEDFTGDGELFMLRVRGESMIDVGIFDGDFVVVRTQRSAENGDIVVAGIPGEEATVKTFLRRRGKVVLRPANPTMDEMVFDADDVQIYGKVVTLAAPPLSPTNAAQHLGAPHEVVALDELAGGVRELGIARSEVAGGDAVRARSGRRRSNRTSGARRAVRRRRARPRADS